MVGFISEYGGEKGGKRGDETGREEWASFILSGVLTMALWFMSGVLT